MDHIDQLVTLFDDLVEPGGVTANPQGQTRERRVAALRDNYGIDIEDTGSHGFHVLRAGGDGIHGESAQGDGIEVMYAGDHGLVVRNASELAGFFLGI